MLADDLVAQLGESAREMPKMQRVRTTLKDNPKYWDTTLNQYTQLGVEYKIKLASLSPVNRLRLEDGEWVSSAGQVYEGYRSEKHIVQGSVVQRDGYWHLEPYTNEKLGIMPQFRGRRIEWFGVSADWATIPTQRCSSSGPSTSKTMLSWLKSTTRHGLHAKSQGRGLLTGRVNMTFAPSFATTTPTWCA